MAGATIAPLTRFACTTSMGYPSILAGGLLLGAQPEYMTYMPYPDGQGNVTWQGGEFGFSAPDGANITLAAITVTHRVSDTTAYPAISAQIYAGGSPVGAPAVFTPSITPIAETVSVTSGISADALPSLAVQVTFQEAQEGLGYVYHAYATVNYSFADSVGIITVAGRASIPVPSVSVTPPVAELVAAGSAAESFSPSFGQPTAKGDLLIGWTFCNSSSASFNITCADPSWTLANTAGESYGWSGLWYKINCGAAEVPPTFSSSGASFVMSQLLEFSHQVVAFDQTGTFTNNSGPDFTVAASAPDTASGNLIIGLATWSGPDATPVTASISGSDSSGTPVTYSTVSNAATTGQIPFAVAWAQASPRPAPARTR